MIGCVDSLGLLFTAIALFIENTSLCKIQILSSDGIQDDQLDNPSANPSIWFKLLSSWYLSMLTAHAFFVSDERLLLKLSIAYGTAVVQSVQHSHQLDDELFNNVLFSSTNLDIILFQRNYAHNIDRSIPGSDEIKSKTIVAFNRIKCISHYKQIFVQICCNKYTF